MTRPYFPVRGGEPPPLRGEVTRRVRFEEVDALGIVWHGRYPSYFEDVRNAVGEQYGVGYLDFYSRGIITPIKVLHVDHHRPLRFGEEAAIEGILHWSDAARINIEYVIRNAERQVTTTGYTVQMMLDREQNLFMVHPPFFQEFRERWRAGELG